MQNVLIVAATRTAIGALGGAFASTPAVQLGAASATASLSRSGLAPADLGEVIIGNVLQAGQGQNPARQLAIAAGVPEHVPAFTVNKVCGSGLKAIDLAYQSISLGRADAVLAGGIENMSLAPFLLSELRSGRVLGDVPTKDSIIADGLTDAFEQVHMGITAEALADEYAISREEQDRFACESQEKCRIAQENDRFLDEIVAVDVRRRKETISVAIDEHPRPDVTLESLAKLRPAFRTDGTVTAGNASGINDGAATVVVLAADSPLAKRIDPAHAVRIRGIAAHGCAPLRMGLGPVGAVRKLLEQTRVRADDIELWELNEAFAAQSIAVLRELQVPPSRANVNGGAIALGHPIGASGARIVVTLIHELKRRHARLGIASLCIGGGMGMAILVENHT